MPDPAAVATAAVCDHEYTLNVQLTHAWCQKCDLVIPMAASEGVRDTIKAQAREAERQRIRDGSVAMTLDGYLVTGTGKPSSYHVPAHLLDGDGDAR